MSAKKKKAGSGEIVRFSFENENLYRKVCGINDSKIRELEKNLSVTIIPRGNMLLLSGQKENVEGAVIFLTKLQENFLKRPDKDSFDSFDLNYIIKKDKDTPSVHKFAENRQSGTHWSPTEKIFTTYKGRHIYPRTANQEAFVQSLMNNLISFAIGPAGTGKTFLSIATACRMMQNGEVERLVLTRPAVEAGESLGFLPGNLSEKVDPYLRPIYDALYECIGYEKVQEFISINKIEIAPIAFMRGRTLSNSFVILDEAQNCTVSQLKMFLTRLGRNSRMSLSGDITQIDLEKGRSGLEKVVYLFKKIPDIGVIAFGKEDITRHPLVEEIVRKFEELM